MFAAVSSKNAISSFHRVISTVPATPAAAPLLFREATTSHFSKQFPPVAQFTSQTQSRAASSKNAPASKPRKAVTKSQSWAPEGNDFIEDAPRPRGGQSARQQDNQRGQGKERRGALPWQAERRAVKEKYPEGYDPRKKLSPDALDGIRALNAQQPEVYTTEVLANEFEVSPEAIRRILKSKWRPSEREAASRQERWEKRGMGIWAAKAALGEKPPVRWRRAIEDTLEEGGQEAVTKLVQGSAAQAIIETGIERKKKAFKEKLGLREEEAALARIQAEARARKRAKKSQQAKAQSKPEATADAKETRVSWMEQSTESDADSLSRMDRGYDDAEETGSTSHLNINSSREFKQGLKLGEQDPDVPREEMQTDPERQATNCYPELVFKEHNHQYIHQSL